MVRYTRTTTWSLVRDQLNFAQVEALNVNGFENDSRLSQYGLYQALLSRVHVFQQDVKAYDDCREYTT